MYDYLLLILIFVFSHMYKGCGAFEDTPRNDITESKNTNAGPARTLTCTIYALILYMAAL